MSWQPANTSSTLQYNIFAGKPDNSSLFFYWAIKDPGVFQMIYHILSTILYLYYILLTIIICVNVMVTLCHLDNDYPHDYFQWPSWAKKKYTFLKKHFVFFYDEGLSNKYLLILMITLLISLMDDMMFCAVFSDVLVKLPFNWFLFDISKTTAFYWNEVSPGTMSRVLLIFSPLIATGLGVISFVCRCILPFTCLKKLYSGDLEEARKRIEKNERKEKIVKRLFKKEILRLDREAKEKKLRKERSKAKPSIIKTQPQSGGQYILKEKALQSAGNKNSNTQHLKTPIFLDDTPPSYEAETLVPTYDEALGLTASTGQ